MVRAGEARRAKECDVSIKCKRYGDVDAVGFEPIPSSIANCFRRDANLFGNRVCPILMIRHHYVMPGVDDWIPEGQQRVKIGLAESR